MAVHAPVRIRRGLAPRAPRRISGPTHPTVRPPRPTHQPRPAMAGHAAPLSVGRVVAVSQGRLFDRLIRGRLWIAVLGIMLMGIVYMQVSTLSMNAGIGRSVKQSSALERQNAALRAELSRLVIGNSVSDAAAHAGMVVPAAGDYHVLTAGDGDAARRAASALTAPVAPVKAAAPVVTTTAPATTSTPAGTPAATPAASTPTSTGTTTRVTPAPTAAVSPGGGTAAPGAQG